MSTDSDSTSDHKGDKLRLKVSRECRCGALLDEDQVVCVACGRIVKTGRRLKHRFERDWSAFFESIFSCCFKLVKLAILLLLLFVLGFAAVEGAKKYSELRRKAPRDDVSSKAAHRAVCPYCRGEGKIVVRYPSPRGDYGQPCPGCGAWGYREMAIPSNGRVCPDCQGMGKILFVVQRAVNNSDYLDGYGHFNQAKVCSRCNGFGYCLDKSKSGK